jgi:hypothetical protein
MHPSPHQDSASPGIIEEGPRWGAPTVVAAIIIGAAGVVVLALLLPLVFTLAFVIIVGVGGRRGRGRGRGRLRTRRFLLRWAQRQLLLWRVPYS